MSNKRSKRNNKKVLKALRQKRANGGRLKAYSGLSNITFDMTDEEIKSMVEAQVAAKQQTPAQPTTTQPSGEGGGSVTVGQAPPQRVEDSPTRDTGSVTVTNPTTTTTTTPTTSTNDPKPTPPKKPGGMGQASKSYQEKVRQYNADLAAWKARNLNVTEGSGSGAATDTADSTAQQGSNTGGGNNMSTNGPPQVEITPPDLFDIDEVETQDVSLEGTTLGDAEQIGAQKAVSYTHLTLPTTD